MHEKTDHGSRILVVDDDPRIGKILRINLGLQGYEIISTTSGAEAIEIVRAREPEVVLLDVVMPGIDGLEVLSRLRNFSKVPVIIFTGHPEIVRIALESGADESIAKPFDLCVLAEKIRLVLGSREAAEGVHGSQEQNSPR